MLRRRTTLSVSAAAALIVAVPVLTGCSSSEARTGAAAVLDGDRITVSEVQAQSELVRDAQRGEPDANEMISSSGWLNRASLDTLIRYQLIERAAKEAGVSVSRREVQKIRALNEQRAGGKDQLEAVLLHQRPLAPEQINDDMRIQLLLEKVAQSHGLNLTSPQGQAGVKKLLTSISKKMDIEVNPRFGEWNDQEIGLGNSQEPWLRELTREQPQGEPLA